MIAQGVKKIEEAARNLNLEKKNLKVEVKTGGKVSGFLTGEIAKIVSQLLHLKKLEKQVQEQIEKWKEHLLAEMEEEGISERPVTFMVKGLGKVTVSKKDVTVQIADAKKLFQVLGEDFWDFVGFRAKKGLVEIACDGDYEKAKEVRECINVVQVDEDTVKIQVV